MCMRYCSHMFTPRSTSNTQLRWHVVQSPRHRPSTHSSRGPPVLQGHTVRVLQLGHGCRAHPCGPLSHVGCTRSCVEVPHTSQWRGYAHVCAHEPEVLATWALPEGEEGALGPGSQPGSEASLGEG